MNNNIEQTYERIKPLVEKMKKKYPPEYNIERLEPALTHDIAEIVLHCEQSVREELLT